MKLGFTKDEDRKGLERIFLGSPKKVRLHASVELPPAYEADAPQSVRAAKAGLAYSATYRVEGRRLVLDRELAQDAREIPPSGFDEASSFVAVAQADFAQHFKVRGHTAATPQVPADAGGRKLYGAASPATTRRNGTGGRRAVEKGPRKSRRRWVRPGMPSAWRMTS